MSELRESFKYYSGLDPQNTQLSSRQKFYLPFGQFFALSWDFLGTTWDDLGTTWGLLKDYNGYAGSDLAIMIKILSWVKANIMFQVILISNINNCHFSVFFPKYCC